MQKISTFRIHHSCFSWAKLAPKTVFPRLIQNPVISSQNKDVVGLNTQGESPRNAEQARTSVPKCLSKVGKEASVVAKAANGTRTLGLWSRC